MVYCVQVIVVCCHGLQERRPTAGSAGVADFSYFSFGFSRRNFCSRDSFENPRVPVHVASLAEFGVNRVSHHSSPFTRFFASRFVKMKVSEDSNPILYGIILNYHSPRGVIVA